MQACWLRDRVSTLPPCKPVRCLLRRKPHQRGTAAASCTARECCAERNMHTTAHRGCMYSDLRYAMQTHLTVAGQGHPSDRYHSQTGDSTCDKGDPAAEIVLLSFSRPDGALLSATPFAGKLEMMLRLAGLPVKGCIGNILDGKHAPKKKVRPRAAGDGCYRTLHQLIAQLCCCAAPSCGPRGRAVCPAVTERAASVCADR